MYIEIECQPEETEETGKNSLIEKIPVRGKDRKEHQGKDHMLV